MTKVNLYRYENADGSVTVSPRRREETDEPYMYRLIADEGKILTDGEKIMCCVDTHEPDIYWEIDNPEPEEADND